jgi:2-oxopent-4-enoate hydratase
VATEQIRRELADELWESEHSRKPIEPLTRRYPDLAVADGYAIQSLNVSRHRSAGARIVGRKVGLTSLPMQQLLGVHEPDFGVLLDHMVVEDGDEVPFDRLLQARVEAEIALVMERDLEGPGVTAARALTAIAGALPALEIVDSRVANWEIKLVDTVADNASCGMFVVGGNIRPLTDIDPRLIGVVISRNGTLADTGAGAAALGNPVRCVAWLANKLAAFGEGLRAGDIVLPGAVHKMIPVAPGDAFRAEFAHLGSVTARFSASPAASAETSR